MRPALHALRQGGVASALRRGSALRGAVRATSNLRNEYSGRMDGSSGKEHVLPSLALESGGVLRDVPCKYSTYGELNEARDNAILVAHALTGNHELDMWWGSLLGPGKALDTEKYFVVCMNTLGSCYGTCGPASPDPRAADGARYGPRFPTVTIRDAVELQASVLRDALQVEQLACVLGGSMGGMISLEFCFRSVAPLARSAIMLSTNGRHCAWQIATSELQRRAIKADAAFKAGEYDRDKPPSSGLGIARAIAMVSYRTHNAYETNFGRRVREGVGEGGDDGATPFGTPFRNGNFQVCAHAPHVTLTHTLPQRAAASPEPRRSPSPHAQPAAPCLCRWPTTSTTRGASSSSSAVSTPTRT